MLRPLALGAMAIATAVVGGNGMRAVFTTRDVSSEGRRVAALDATHDLLLGQARVAKVGWHAMRIRGRGDICDLQSRPSQHLGAG